MKKIFVLQNVLTRFKKYNLIYSNLLKLKIRINFFPESKDLYFFFMGEASFHENDYQLAVDSFEFVLHNSKNEDLKNYSNEYLEKIKDLIK